MKVAIIKEKSSHETRVAASPDTTKELIVLGLEVHIQSKAGELSGFSDEDYRQAGATVATDAATTLKGADIILKVLPPTAAEIGYMKKGAILVGLLGSDVSPTSLKKYASHKLSAFAMEFIPRITRAQSMDVLSSQSNLAGYKAVIDAVYHFGQAVPMMMTAAGTIKPARTLILGAGVAGLQAIATARRLGAVVSAFDVRPEVKEQVESLGASFIEVDPGKKEDDQAPAVYAKEPSEAYKKKQAELIHQTAKTQDIIICTALIPGRPAPMLISEKTLKDINPGSVIVDLATASGGNCAWSAKNKVITKRGITIIGYENMAGRIPKDASKLYAKNLLNFITPMVNKKLQRIRIDFEDQITQSTMLTHDGKVVHQSFKKTSAPKKENKK